MGLPIEAVATVTVLLLAGAAEMARPWRHAGSETGRRWIVNLSLYALGFTAAYLSAPGVALVVGLSHLRLGLGDETPEWLRLSLAVLVLDLLDYGFHRASHRVRLLWRLHQPHHSDLALDVTTAFRHHPFEAIAAAVVIGGGGALIGFTPGEIAAYGAIAMSVQLVAHGNVEVPPRLMAALSALLVTPAFHRVHHSRRQVDTDSNYGQVFTVWDRLFGSYRRHPADTIEFGLDECREPAAQRLPAILLQPLRPR